MYYTIENLQKSSESPLLTFSQVNHGITLAKESSLHSPSLEMTSG